MSPEEITTREKVLQTTVELMGKGGPEKLTIRQIAAEAGVNVAAINYHFQSKENLVDEAIHAFSSKAFAAGMKVFSAPDLSAGQRLIRFFQGYAYGLVEFSGVTRTAFMGIMNAASAESRYAGMMKEMFVAARRCVGEMTGERDEAELSRRALMLFSGVVFPFLCRELFKSTSGIDYGNRAERDRYIEMLVGALKTKKE
jgi:TetR/AcrR family transcriptional regulator, regulator of cefoperazone and chloramphenicol sensitivity